MVAMTPTSLSYWPAQSSDDARRPKDASDDTPEINFFFRNLTYQANFYLYFSNFPNNILPTGYLLIISFV
jgi:hypothetical protein